MSMHIRFGPILMILFWICISFIGCSTQPVESDRKNIPVAVSNISNDDIQWDGTPVGLIPEVKGAASKLVLNLRDRESIGLLISALDYDEKYVAAHVLLTFLTGKSEPITSTSWNGLIVELKADNSVAYDPSNKKRLKAKWLQNQPGATKTNQH